ncbi:MAG: hypothetical protein Q4P18_07960 [Methanobrevibacter sp.]|uniref:hypothetical protein n=1 Tax=Methanobrevibacter sp. TaxID=66852 RepID=UPI0026DEBDBA|nr:hypothetical protein [Methanobrevibacter sp.]MDO5849455.1 hypothetical protein [Methanobrevibacter sp.]
MDQKLKRLKLNSILFEEKVRFLKEQIESNNVNPTFHEWGGANVIITADKNRKSSHPTDYIIVTPHAEEIQWLIEQLNTIMSRIGPYFYRVIGMATYYYTEDKGNQKDYRPLLLYLLGIAEKWEQYSIKYQCTPNRESGIFKDFIGDAFSGRIGREELQKFGMGRL